MHSHWISQTIPYDGSQLRSHWIYEATGSLGDAIAAWCGPARVDATHMVDLEDRASKAWIESRSMLHFLIEHFAMDLLQAIVWQRLLVAIAREELGHRVRDSRFRRCGNDLFDGDAKLSVSIATVSPVSAMVHFGINIISDGTPVPTRGLTEYAIDPVTFAHTVMERYCDEVRSSIRASAKVRAVR
ncbi:MAG: DUF366 family protein [Deltaproteobacteria bacterium]|nr:DUF366 family protein [Deltaproteobacteria bacterium]